MSAGIVQSRRSYPLRVEAWSEIPGLAHGFLGRAHGLPPGACRLDDLRDALAKAGEEPKSIVAARQVHGTTVLASEDLASTRSHSVGVDAEELPAGDAWVSGCNDLLLTIRTADCVPILLVAPRAHAVAAVHAGWRGTLAGVIEAAMTALQSRYGARPTEVSAAIGPAIGGCCYVFGAEHQEAFLARFGADAASVWRHDSADPKRGYLELRTLCRLVLERTGISPTAITQLGPCTADHPDELHSFRRDGSHAGRQLSYIGWRSKPALVTVRSG